MDRTARTDRWCRRPGLRGEGLECPTREREAEEMMLADLAPLSAWELFELLPVVDSQTYGSAGG